MSLATTIGAGTLIGGVAAFAVYAAAAPSDQAPAAVSVPASFAPVPTVTVTQTADDCVAPAVVKGDECVVVKPGPTVVVTDPAPVAPVPAPRTASDQADDQAGDQADDQGEDAAEHRSGDEQESQDEQSEDHESDSQDHHSQDHDSDDGGGEHDG